MNNRVAFIDFVRGLLTLNPLERWSPQQAKLHPFITQQKFTQPFVPPMNLKSPSNKPPAPGVQQQQQAEAVSKQRAQAQAQAAAQAQQNYAIQMNQYQPPPTHQAPPVYNNMYATPQQGAPPPYPTSSYAPQPQVSMMPQQQPTHMAPNQYAPSQSLYAQAATRAGRQRASTMDQQQGGIPAAIQRVASHLDPNAPIRLQPSPAYYPPPPDSYADSPTSGRRANERNRRNRDFIRTLEDGAMQQWH